jgi:hypothetical protein
MHATLVYPGLTLTISWIEHTPANIDSMRITGTDYNLVGGLHLGLPLGAFQKFLGNSNSSGKSNISPIGNSGRKYLVSDDTLFTQEGGGTEIAYQVVLKTDKQGRVISLSWVSVQSNGY